MTRTLKRRSISLGLAVFAVALLALLQLSAASRDQSWRAAIDRSGSSFERQASRVAPEFGRSVSRGVTRVRGESLVVLTRSRFEGVSRVSARFTMDLLAAPAIAGSAFRPGPQRTEIVRDIRVVFHRRDRESPWVVAAVTADELGHTISPGDSAAASRVTQQAVRNVLRFPPRNDPQLFTSPVRAEVRDAPRDPSARFGHILVDSAGELRKVRLEGGGGLLALPEPFVYCSLTVERMRVTSIPHVRVAASLVSSRSVMAGALVRGTTLVEAGAWGACGRNDAVVGEAQVQPRVRTVAVAFESLVTRRRDIRGDPWRVTTLRLRGVRLGVPLFLSSSIFAPPAFVLVDAGSVVPAWQRRDLADQAGPWEPSSGRVVPSPR